MMDPHFYSLFGLSIASDMPLPELVRIVPVVAPDVIVRMRADAASPTIAEPYPIDDHLSLTIDGIARYTVARGAEIVVDPDPGALERNVRLYLLGSAMGMLLHQRGLLPLHANSIEIDGRAFLFMGHSGAGKSTLAAWFHDRGYRVIADDVSVIGFDGEGRPAVRPGLPRLRLWRDTLDATGRDAALFERSYAGDDSYDKYDVPIEPAGLATGDVELSAIYLLAKGDQFGLSALSGMEAADAVFANTYRGRYVESMNQQRPHWEATLNLIRATPIFRLERRWDHRLMREEIEPVVEHARSLIG